jgi:DNA-binding GntR family transcriptional regulator
MMAKDTLSEKAYQTLKDKIITLKSGSYLSARQFANEIGMSYTPVREAFLRLQREGAIKQVPNVGFFVETIDWANLYQSYEVRECIEPFVLKKAFNRFTPEHTAAMRNIVEKQSKALSSGKIMQYMRLDIDLHEVMFRTDFYENHFHEFRGRTGGAIPVGNRHVHFIESVTTPSDGHRHTFEAATLIDNPIGEDC